MQDREDYPYEAEAAQLHNTLKVMRESGIQKLVLTDREIECLISAIEVAYDY